jgi:hypothetical protein
MKGSPVHIKDSLCWLALLSRSVKPVLFRDMLLMSRISAAAEINDIMKDERNYKESHNVSMIMYHIVCPAKYRRTVITGEGDEKLKEVCKGYRSKV